MAEQNGGIQPIDSKAKVGGLQQLRQKVGGFVQKWTKPSAIQQQQDRQGLNVVREQLQQMGEPSTTETSKHLEKEQNPVENLLQSLTPEIPQVFKDQARLTAEYIKQLDGDSEHVSEDIQQFVKQLKNTHFISWTNFNYRGEGNPERSLPKWLQTPKGESRFMTPEEKAQWDKKEQEIEEKFDEYTSSRNLPYMDRPNGRYFSFETVSTDETPMAQHYKCYIADSNLHSALENGNLATTFDKLAELGVSPNQMKLFEGNRLVLYFDGPIDNFDTVDEVFKKYAIEARGPAQDIIEVRKNVKGELYEKVENSNDGALGEGGHNPIEYTVQEYTPEAFLENYLKMCLYVGKNPALPYTTSFVYLHDADNYSEEDFPDGVPDKYPADNWHRPKMPKEQIPVKLQEAAQLVGYPTMYVDSGFKFRVPLTPDNKDQ